MNSGDVNILIRQAKRGGKQELNLSGKEIESVPTDLYNLSSVLVLNLANNKITEIDRQIENLKNLKELDLSNNNIENLPIEIVQLSNLLTLKLNNNPIMNFLQDISTTNWKSQVKSYLLNKMKSGVNNLNSGKNNLDWLADPIVSHNAPERNNNPLSMTFFQPKSSSLLDKGDSDQRLTDMDSDLQKEKLNNKRLKKEIERLTLQQSSNGGMSISSKDTDFILKSILLHKITQVFEKLTMKIFN